MKRYLLTLATMLTFALGATAQDWWTPADRHQYNDETVVYATLQLNTWPADYGNEDYSVAAFIGDECRAVADAPVAGESGLTVFVARVLGDREADKGQPVRFEIRYNPGGYGLVYDVTPSLSVTFDGESWGRPSQPVVLSGPGFTGAETFAFDPAVINVGEQVDIVSLFRGGAMPKPVSVSLSDTSVAALDGTVVTGLQPGTVSFTVHFPGTSLGNDITVVLRATALNILNDEVRIDIDHPETLQPKLDAAYELLPQGTTDVIAWLIDDETIVGRKADGQLVPKAVGDTYVTPVAMGEDGQERLRPADGRRIHVVVYENVPLQRFTWRLSSHPYNRETVQMTLTPVPANATFNIGDLRFRHTSDYGWEQVWNTLNMTLVAREPIIYDVTFPCPFGADIRAYWADAPDTEVRLYEEGHDDYGCSITPYFRLDLKEGWQWRSNTCGVLWDDDLELGFGPDLIEARTQDALLYNDPEWGYFGTLMDDGIDDNVAYKVRMGADYRSRTVGSTTTADAFSIGVSEGWTWIPTPYYYDRRLQNVFRPEQLAEGMVIVSKEQGSAEWNGTEWEGDLLVLPREQSFLFYMPEGAPFTLRYNNERDMPQGNEQPDSTRQTDSRYRAPRADAAELHSVARRFRDNMTMVATMPQVADAADYELRAYVGDELRGTGRANAAGRFFVTVHADGGERVSFALVSLVTGAAYDVDEQLTVSRFRLGSLSEPVALHSAQQVQGIGAVRSSERTAHSYDLLGRPVGDAAKGISIRRTADGQVRKVVKR